MPSNSDPLLDNNQAAYYLNLPPKTLNNWRSRGEGPRYIKIGARVFYKQSALDEFIAECEKATQGSQQVA